MIRKQVREFLASGPLPAEDVATPEGIDVKYELLKQIKSPLTDEEAQALIEAFGDDSCHGVAWTLLHLIETAPGAVTAQYRRDSSNEWVQLLNARVSGGGNPDYRGPDLV